MSEQPSAADLIEQARISETSEELDDIEAQANGRVTVLDAVNQRRQELSGQQQQSQTGETSQESPVDPNKQQPARGPQGEVIGEPLSPLPIHESQGGGQGLPTVHGEPGGAAPGTDKPGDIADPLAINQMFQAEQVDPPLGPYPDPPLGPYPDPVAKNPQPPETIRNVEGFEASQTHNGNEPIP